GVIGLKGEFLWMMIRSGPSRASAQIGCADRQSRLGSAERTSSRQSAGHPWPRMGAWMAKRVLGMSAVVALLGMLIVGPVRAASGSGGLHLVSSQRLSDRLIELTMTTDALTDATHVRVLLPSGYDSSGATRYPVL